MPNEFAIAFIAIWFFASVAVGLIGEKRRIGFMKAALLSLFLSPGIAIIAVLFSPTHADLQEKKEQMELLRKMAEKQ